MSYHVQNAVADITNSVAYDSIIYALNAQTHATLALVEQQRIANLIALYAADTSEGLNALMHNTNETFGARYEVRPEILEALGMGGAE